MFIDRKTLRPEAAMPLEELRAQCMGCKDCKGACLALIQMHVLPEILAERREGRS